MIFQAAATALAIIHAAFIVFVAIGALLVLRWRWLMYLQLPAAIWGTLIEIGQWECPITRWENLSLQRAGQSGYGEGFIAHHLFGVIYPGGLSRGFEIMLAVLVIAINFAVYYHVFHGQSARRRGTTAADRA
ncbi:MAG: DUF2784 domain-containing protein [Thermoanaerobaculia bacterium]